MAIIATLLKLGALCNDGTPAAYYLAESPGSDRWLIYLPGGGHCDDQRAFCRDRAPGTTPPYADGATLPLPVSTGLFSLDLSGVNVVVAHYCSSDLYSGDLDAPAATSAGAWYFQGRRQLEAIAADLAIPAGDRVVLAGSSAGCFGVYAGADLWPGAALVADGCYVPVGYAAEAQITGALTLWGSVLTSLYAVELQAEHPATILTSQADPTIMGGVGWTDPTSWSAAVWAEGLTIPRADLTHRYLLSADCVTSGVCGAILAALEAP
jgi:hypothetical protein